MMESPGNSQQKVNMINDRKKQVFGFGLFTAFIIIILLAGAIGPSINTIVSILAKISEKQVLQEQLDQKITTLGSLNTQYENLGEQIRDLELVFPNNEDYSLFMSNIEVISRNHNFTISNISFEEIDLVPEETSVTTVLNFKKANITIAGKEDDLIPLLREIEEMPMYPIIRSVSYSANEDIDGNTSFSIEVVIYKIEETNFYE